MNRITHLLAFTAISAASIGGAQAQYSALPLKAPPAAAVPASIFFFGVGGSASHADFGKQDVFAVGTSNVFLNGALVNTGAAAGPAEIGMPSVTRLAPVLQGGFMQRFSGSDWMIGAKLSYSYLDAAARERNALLPQSGAYVATGSGVVTPFTGNAVVRNFETRVDHQIAFVPFAGHAYERGFVYGGIGPTLSRTRTNLNGLVGFADITGQPSDVSGLPVNLTSGGWVFGGMAVIGATYFLDRDWFIDGSYSYARTARQTDKFFGTFSNPNGINGTNTTGDLIGRSSHNLTTQAVTVSINRAFNLR